MSGVDFLSHSTQNQKMKEALEMALSTASSPSPLLIVGAAGTGKTSLAKWIHQKGRPGKNIRILGARELRDRAQSLFEALSDAREGTLVVEEVDILNEPSQALLMEVLESRHSGSDRCRFIFTSRRDLRALVRGGHFRQDLFYKVTVLTSYLPSLAERLEDLDMLLGFMVDVHSILQGKQGLQISSEALSQLRSWDWPGNIRELENVVERAVTLATSSSIDSFCIRFESPDQVEASDFGPGMSLSEVERRLILQTLELTAQNRTRAAQMLGISIRTLRNKLNEYKDGGVRESL